MHELEEFDACVALQSAIWNYAPSETLPRRMFLVAERIGGQVLGAFDGERMVGYALAFPAYRAGHAYLHSQMVGVLAEYRNAGIGRLLKLAQRDDAIERGFDLMEWTFDPLEIKNAHLNIVKLGAIARRYKHDFYGPSSSPLQGGLPTDRLYAEWWLRSERVLRVMAGEPLVVDAMEDVESACGNLCVESPSRANVRVRRRCRRRMQLALEAAFARGLAVVGYERSAAGDGRFQLGKWNEDWRY